MWRRDEVSKGFEESSYVWLTRVETIENRFNGLNSTRTVELQRLCCCGVCSKRLRLSYSYGRRIFEMLHSVGDLNSQGDFEEVAQPIFEVKPQPPTIFGRMLDRAWDRLMDVGTSIMGLYGMGGVGKTTLLTQINNGFCDTNNGFNIVVWVGVSRYLQVEKIQNAIAELLGLSRGEWNKKTESKATDIHTSMSNKKFVLLLDDIWREVDLKEIGVPFPTRENGCKVVFTTRSMEVCGHMGVDDPIEVKCLELDEAWDLFGSKVGKITLESHPNILELACQVARKCRGLPLALNIIGENMACKRTEEEWHQAIDILASSAAEFLGMEDHILPVLKYSYYSLKDMPVKSCFQYCALFPEDFLIEKEKLVDYWICEGFVDEKQGKTKAKNEACEMIGTLLQACLLTEEGRDKSRAKMHDVVREMALWISSDFGKHKERCIVQAGVGLREVPTVENWRSVRRMSLMENEIKKIYDSPNCPDLTTLLLQKTGW